LPGPPEASVREAVLESPKRRVLAVDDEPEILQLYRTFLKYRGYEVIAVDNATACLDFLATDSADLLLLDVNMPGIDGLKVLEMIRSDQRQRDMRVIMVSARRDEDTVVGAVQLGCDGFLLKPFKFKDLGERIAVELFSVDDVDIRGLLKGSLVTSPGTLLEPGLSELNILACDAYTVQHQGVTLAIVLPRGMNPTMLARALPVEVAKRVTVYYRHPQRWKRVWPRSNRRD
jgi:CheY-like chemotaxis protein